ncbi:hypothetical protein HC229_16555, partial [Flavobacterium sp. D33]|nr:hypothetical protein [Flavobacterium selenitireducens]
NAADLASNTPIADPTAFPSGTATLYAVVSNLGTDVTPDPAPCRSDAVTVEVTVEALVTPVITGETTICIDNGSGVATPITLTASPAGAYTYQWFLDGVDTGLTGQSIQVDLAGEYTVVLTSTSASACVSGPSQAFEVVESSQPFNLSYTVSGAFQDNQSIQVSVEGVNPDAFEYSLDGGPWLANGGLFTNVGPGEHTVAVRSACGEASIV